MSFQYLIGQSCLRRRDEYCFNVTFLESMKSPVTAGVRDKGEWDGLEVVDSSSMIDDEVSAEDGQTRSGQTGQTSSQSKIRTRSMKRTGKGSGR